MMTGGYSLRKVENPVNLTITWDIVKLAIRVQCEVDGVYETILDWRNDYTTSIDFSYLLKFVGLNITTATSWKLNGTYCRYFNKVDQSHFLSFELHSYRYQFY